MPVYRTRALAEAYGRGLGVLLPDARIPYAPGDPGHAGSFRHPVMYRVVPGLTLAACRTHDPRSEAAIRRGAAELAGQGVRAIINAGACMLPYQAAIRADVDVPVCLSILLQLAVLAPALPQAQPIGVIDSHATRREALLQQLGLSIPNRLVASSMENSPAFAAVLDQAGELDTTRLEAEAVAVACRLKERHPDLGLIVLNSPLLAPYAARIAAATELGVCHSLTVAATLYAATHQRAYQGHY